MIREADRSYHYFVHEATDYRIDIDKMIALKQQAPPKSSEPRADHFASKRASGSPRAADNSKSTPLFIICLLLTQSCNLRCIYCYGDGGTYGSGGRMDQTTALLAVDWLIERSGSMPTLYVSFLGGEPFLEFDLMQQIVDYAKAKASAAGKKVVFQVTTNGSLLTDTMIEYMKTESFALTVSLDGAKEIQDQQRPFANGTGSYDQTLPRVQKLLAVLPNAVGHAVLVNETDPVLVRNSLESMGFKYTTVAPQTPNQEDHANGRLKTRKVASLLAGIEQEVQQWQQLLQSHDIAALKTLAARSDLYKAIIALLHNKKTRQYCGLGRSTVAIAANGDIYSCHRFVGQESYKIGSILKKQFDNGQHQTNFMDHNENCVDCFARYYCAGGCQHDNVMLTDSVYRQSDELCQLRKRELELAAVIVSGLSAEQHAFLLAQAVFPPKPCPLDL